MSLQDITITGSINSIATQSYGQRTYIASTDEQSFPIEQATGSNAGVWPDFIEGTNYTVDLIVNVTQSWSASNTTPLGIIPYIHDTMDEFINGEFSGSSYVVTDGNLNDPQCEQFLEVSTLPTPYKIFFYPAEFFGAYIDTNTAPSPGQMLVYYENVGGTKKQIKYLKIARIDEDGNDNTFTLQALDRIRWTDSVIGLIELRFVTFAEFQDYYYYTPIPTVYDGGISGFSNNNILDYKFRATSSLATISPTRGNGATGLSGETIYFTNGTGSWDVIDDASSGFNSTTEQYFFPLTPNCNTQLTASLNITIPCPVTLSLGIGQRNVPIDQLIYTIPNGTPVYDSSNWLRLNTGTHNIVVTSSNQYYPVQEYAYEVNGYFEKQEIRANPYLTGSGGLPVPALIPDTYQCSDPGNNNGSSEWTSIFEYYGLYLPSSYPGGVIMPVALQGYSQACQLRNLTGDKVFTSGSTYNIQIEIPPPSSNEDLSSTFTANSVIYGPSAVAITCSANYLDSDPIISDPAFIGYIPSGAYGIFNFTYTCPNNSNRDLCLVTPASASSYISGDYASLAVISRISVQLADPITVNSFTWRVTQSQSPLSNSNILTLEPGLSANFYRTDCDVLMNNYSVNDISTNVQRVLYEEGSIIPSNLQQIIAGTAEYAEVNDYLYNAGANVLPRYAGTRTTSNGFNLPFINGLSNEELSGISDQSLNINNGDSNIENTTTYFGYFTELKSNNPIYKGTTSPILKYIIREDGEVINPSADEASYYNTLDSFPASSKATITLLNNTTTIFSSTQSILLSGESYTPILHNIAAANDVTATFTGSINFNNLQGVVSNVGTPPSYSLQVVKTSQQISGPNALSVNVGVPINLFYNGINASLNDFIEIGGIWDATYNTSIFQPNFSFSGNPQNYVRSIVNIQRVDTYGIGPFGGGTSFIRVKLWKRPNVGPDELIKSKDSNSFLGGYASTNFFIFTHDFIPNIGDKVYVTVELINGVTGGTGRIDNYSWKLQTLGIAVPTTSTPFWFTGSSNSTTITASADLSQALLGNYIQQDIEGSGFDSFQLPCNIRIGDEFRFGYDENNVFKVMDVQATGSSQLVYVLDKAIPNISSLNINNFTVRRKVKDYITGITLDRGLINQINDGFILPEYPSQALKKNLPNILNDLYNKTLI